MKKLIIYIATYARKGTSVLFLKYKIASKKLLGFITNVLLVKPCRETTCNIKENYGYSGLLLHVTFIICMGIIILIIILIFFLLILISIDPIELECSSDSESEKKFKGKSIIIASHKSEDEKDETYIPESSSKGKGKQKLVEDCTQVQTPKSAVFDEELQFEKDMAEALRKSLNPDYAVDTNEKNKSNNPESSSVNDTKDSTSLNGKNKKRMLEDS